MEKPKEKWKKGKEGKEPEKSIVETNFPRKRPLIGGLEKLYFYIFSDDCQKYMLYVYGGFCL